MLTVFKPQVPPVVPTPESVMRGAIATKSDFIFCVPSFIEVCGLRRCIFILWAYQLRIRSGRSTRNISGICRAFREL